jgi:3-methylcrotonyl-CoA carboxylase beta subunit
MAAMRGLVEDLREKIAAIREGGGEAARRRHLARGKSPPPRADAAAAHPDSEPGMLILIAG